MSTGRYLCEHYFEWTSASLRPSVFEEVLQLFVALLLSIVFNRAAFERRIVFPPLNWSLTVVAFFISVEIPLQKLQLGREARGWLFSIGIFGLIGLPNVLSFYLWPTEGRRRIISLALYSVIVTLLTADIFKK